MPDFNSSPLGINFLNYTIRKSNIQGQDVYDKYDVFGNPLSTMSLEDLDSTLTYIKPTTPNPSWSDKFNNGFIGKNMTTINSGLNLAKDITGSIKRGQTTFEGPKGDVRAGIEEGWDTVSDIAANFGPYGLMASLAMKGVGVLNNIQGAIFGATDGMTTKDAIMDSPIGFLTGIGWANQGFGKRSHTITKDNESFETVGASYGGTGSLVDDALTKSGKKYGLFSRGDRKEANTEIAEATRQLNLMASIASNATDRFNIRNSMSAINGNAKNFALLGGYDQSAVRVGKKGVKLERLNEVAEKIQLLRLRRENELVDPSEPPGNKIKDSREENSAHPQNTFIELISEILEFKEGGSINVIPDGALHARKHNMDIEGVTPKGIPVISEKEGGEIEQQAEIEKEEIIFRLEVTKKLEELAQDGSDNAAIEAGRLLVNEILYNTIDKTNNLL